MDDVTLLHAPKRKYLSNRRLTFITVIVAALMLVVLVVAGMLSMHAATQTDFVQKNMSPSLSHPFGTDWMGRDMLARTVAGLSISVFVGLIAACASSLIALVLASIAALGPSKADTVVGWLIDLIMGVPHIILLILISFALGGGFIGVTVGVALTHWPSLTRVLRAEILQCKNSDYVLAAKRLGISNLRIAISHMLPFVLPQLLTGLVLMFPHAILHEAAITFLGFGLPPEQPAIGVILSESMSYLSAGMWWLALFPGLALIVSVMLFDVVGGGIRKMIDPNTSQE